MNAHSDPHARSDRRRNDEAILVAAARVLARDPGGSMQQIATEAGVSRLTVYRRYPDRSALLLGLRNAVDTEVTSVLDAFPGWHAGFDALRSLTVGLAGVLWRYPVVAARFRPSGPDLDPDQQEQHEAPSPTVVGARIVALLEQAQGEGIIVPDLPADYLEELVFGLLALSWRHDPDMGPQAAGDRVFAVLSTGVRADAPRSRHTGGGRG